MSRLLKLLGTGFRSTYNFKSGVNSALLNQKIFYDFGAKKKKLVQEETSVLAPKVDEKSVKGR